MLCRFPLGKFLWVVLFLIHAKFPSADRSRLSEDSDKNMSAIVCMNVIHCDAGLPLLLRYNIPKGLRLGCPQKKITLKYRSKGTKGCDIKWVTDALMHLQLS